MNDRSHSVLETSLTELAFIFFFIVAIFATWKVNNIQKELNNEIDKHDETSKIASNLIEKLEEYKSYYDNSEINPEELFNELKKGKDAIKKVSVLKEEKEKLKKNNEILRKKIEERKEISELLMKNDLSVDEFSKNIREYKKIEGIVKEFSKKKDNIELSSVIGDLVIKFKNIQGQNINLAKKMESLGNGLDHPPCWANSENGSIEYVFDVVIGESNIKIFAGWPNSRAKEAISNYKIQKSIGVYENNQNLLLATNDLFQESKENKCRHFVRIYDHAQTKKSFKYYLSGIETHFYKYLTTSQYEEQ